MIRILLGIVIGMLLAAILLSAGMQAGHATTPSVIRFFAPPRPGNCATPVFAHKHDIDMGHVPYCKEV